MVSSGGGGLSAGAEFQLRLAAALQPEFLRVTGHFQGLRVTSASQGSGLLNPSAFLRTNDSAGIATDSGASFNVGGKAMIEGSPSLSADVGAKTRSPAPGFSLIEKNHEALYSMKW